MSSIKRRHFLQFAGSTLAAIGLSQFDFLRQANQYGRVLAQTTPRKLALLVGINQYTNPISSLKGCLTDVELQCRLLVHRFGFIPDDIMVLTDKEATRAAILEAFEQHLIAQAKPGDVVVFHYSGHGSLVKDPNPLTAGCEANCDFNGTLVPYDPPTRSANSELNLPHIMGRSLFFLRNAIQTENLTLVLDSCYSGAGTRGNVVVRSASSRLTSGEIPSAPQVELDYQQAWLARLNMTPADFQQRRQENRVNGVAIGSASRDQKALDAPFNGNQFHAGAFTYLMARYLWQLARDESFGTVRTNLIRSTQALTSSELKSQVPIFETPPGSKAEQKPVYFLSASNTPAEAVVIRMAGQQVEFWLGGVSTQNLQSKKTVFVLLDRAGQTVLNGQGEPIEIQQEDYVKPLYGYGSVKNGDLSAVQPGMLLRERIVGLPANPKLVIGLDASLVGDMETARTELGNALLSAQNISRIQVVEQQSDMNYLFGRMIDTYRQELADRGASELPPVGSVGLFNSDCSAIVPESFGRADEPVSAAVNRLKPKLKLLLVSQVLRAITATNSDLQITGEIFTADARVPLSSRGARDASSLAVTSTANRFRVGEEIQFKVENHEEREVYLSCIAIDAKGELIVLYPANWDAPEEAARIDGEASLVVPRSEDELKFRVRGTGFIELLTLVSTEPLSLALKGLQTIARGRGVSRGFVGTNDDEALNVIGDLLGDLDNISRSRNNDATVIPESTRDERIRDTNTLAAFSTMVEIVA